MAGGVAFRAGGGRGDFDLEEGCVEEKFASGGFNVYRCYGFGGREEQ